MGADAKFHCTHPWTEIPKHLQAMLLRSQAHKGASFLEIYQNCNTSSMIGAFDSIHRKKAVKADEVLVFGTGQAMDIWCHTKTKALSMDGFKPVIVDLAEGMPVQTIFGYMMIGTFTKHR
jgi:2-oxoglutarate ferredoxin oxidoreductase subunit beta